MKKYFGALALTVFANSVLLSQTTTVFDYSFGNNGKVIANPGPNQSGKLFDIVLQPDGKILVGGRTSQPSSGEDYLVMRYNTNGTLDNSFGAGGVVISAIGNYDEGIYRLLLQPDGKILALGNLNTNIGANICVVRYNTNGTVDNTFGTSGNVIIDITGVNDLQNPADIALQSDGKILFGGTAFGQDTWNSEFALVRLKTNGVIDSTFGTNGIVYSYLTQGYDFLSDIDIQTDNKVVAVGTIQEPPNASIVTSRYTINGGLDASFDGNGYVFDTVSTIISDYINTIIVQPDGKILLGGTSSEFAGSQYLLMRYNSNGSPDNTFGTNGVVLKSFLSDSYNMVDMILQANGKILVLGEAFVGGQATHLARFNTNGTVDNTLNADGHAEVDISPGVDDNMLALAIQPDGKILVAGFIDTNQTAGTAVIARFTANMIPVTIIGINDYVFTTTETLVYPNPLQDVETLKYTLADNENISINLIDNQGKLVAEFVKNEARNKGNHEEFLTLPPTLPNGTYFIEIASPKGKESIKVIK